MTRADLHDDDALFAALRAAIDSASPVPPDAVATARAVFELSRVDSELAQLVFDSLADAVPVGMRADGEHGSRSLCFETTLLAIDVEVLPDGSILGQIDPPAAVSSQIETSAGADTLRVDARGRFHAILTDRRFRLRFDLGSRHVTTPWIKR